MGSFLRKLVSLAFSLSRTPEKGKRPWERCRFHRTFVTSSSGPYLCTTITTEFPVRARTFRYVYPCALLVDSGGFSYIHRTSLYVLIPLPLHPGSSVTAVFPVRSEMRYAVHPSAFHMVPIRFFIRTFPVHCPCL